ncbi:MAG TPA: BadF/BadG/BcrA/BcrD ATPase family protein [Gammaproteobacteria bacterium]
MLIGIDVGSTTVKCVVVEPESLEIRWSRYERHETRQAEKLLELIEAIQQAFPQTPLASFRAFITGSGAGPLSEPLGARFVQEVNAVTLAVEKLHPDVNSVMELGGQDAKMILFKVNPDTGERQVITSMNDKCASGTGATIDKCVIKVGLNAEQLAALEFDPQRLHHVAAKCGVFAETDIVNLIKSGVPAGEVMNSLADAIVMQNLSVLTRGNTLMPKVLLLGGPNTYLRFLQQAWRLRIPQTWAERGYAMPDLPAEELVLVPQNSQYYAAYGAVVFGTQDAGEPVEYRGIEALRTFIQRGRQATDAVDAGKPLVASHEELAAFRKEYAIPPSTPARFEPGTVVRGYIGLDGGSTSSKAVLIDEQGELLKKEYRLSQGNPIQDTKEILANIKQYVTGQGATLEVLGFGATGYAADVLEKAVRVDANIVETVAHMMSAQKYCGEDIDVICDIGGQDIKVLFLQHGQVKSFRLSNQCSAGNGMLLQAMAAQFGVDVKDYAEVAFKAGLSPRFSYGCAVFLDTDRVNFQKEGFSKEELFAGLAQVLPKNVWQYVVQIPRMAELGRKYVLQGGTQYNLAAVKAQVDYIHERVPEAEVRVHPHTGEAGAIGAALEAKRVVERRGHSTFIGLDEAIDLHYTARTDESTRCTFCDNLCSRTFIDTQLANGETSRYIAGFSCEKGTVESQEAVIELGKERKRLKGLYPNLVDYEANLLFRHFYKPAPLPEAGTPHISEEVRSAWFGLALRRKVVEHGFRRSDAAAAARRAKVRVGIPRCLNAYSLAPFLRTYLEVLGLDRRNILFSDQTSEELFHEGGKYGSVDPCYPAKVSLAHVYNLLHPKGNRQPVNYLWFPSVTDIGGFVTHTMGDKSCPVVAGTPMVARAAFTKEKDFFAEAGCEYLADALDFTHNALLKTQLFELWGERLAISRDESDLACEQGLEAQQRADEELQERGLEVLNQAERDNGVVLLMVGRPYHNDPGLNHEILEEFQTLGYPVLSIRSIPKDPAYLQRFFADDLASGAIEDVFDIRDVWPENYSVNSAQKVWATKFAARHPNVAVIDLSSFKCGHDAPTYGIIDKIIATSKTPYLAMHDLDANKPSGSIKIRVKTFAYSLELYREQLQDEAGQRSELDRAVAAKRCELVEKRLAELAQQHRTKDAISWHSLESAYRTYLEKGHGAVIPLRESAAQTLAMDDANDDAANNQEKQRV